jgi:hypothetical protein
VWKTGRCDWRQLVRWWSSLVSSSLMLPPTWTSRPIISTSHVSNSWSYVDADWTMETGDWAACYSWVKQSSGPSMRNADLLDHMITAALYIVNQQVVCFTRSEIRTESIIYNCSVLGHMDNIWMSVASARTSGGTRASGWAQSRQINCGRQMRHCIAKKRKVEKNLVATSNHTACNMVKEFRNI